MGGRYGSINYYYFHAHQCSLSLSRCSHRHSTLLCFIYHPIEFWRVTLSALYFSSSNNSSSSVLVYAKHRITYVNAITVCVRFGYHLTIRFIANQIRFCERYMMTNRCVDGVCIFMRRTHFGCIRHNDAHKP